MKRLYFSRIKSLLIIILTFTITISSFFVNVNAAPIQFEVASEASERLTNFAIDKIVSQTGYRVANQSEIDAMRSSFKKEFPTWDFTTMPVGADDKYSIEHDRIEIKLNQKIREWANDVVGTMPNNNITTGESTGKSTIGTISRLPASFLYISCSAGSTLNYRISTQGTFFIQTTKTESNYIPSWGHTANIATVGVKILDSSMDEISTFWIGAKSSVDSEPMPSPPTLSVSVVTNSGQSSDFLNITQTNQKSDFVPYPKNSSELADGTVPTKIQVPYNLSQDGTITPTVPDITFPDSKIQPDSDGKVDIGSATITYTKPTIDPGTGEIVDPATDPTPTDPKTDTPNPDDLTVPKNDVPQLNFKPLMDATRKFPFCIPWDLWDTYKIFEGDSEPFKYEFNEVDVNFAFIGCGPVTVLPHFILDFADYPQLDTLIQVFKFLELMCFIVFLILKTRNLIRG